MKNIDLSQYVNLSNAAKFLNVSYTTIYRWVYKEGKLSIDRVDGYPYVMLDDLKRLKKEREGNGTN